jgi:uncharacterized protein (TIRG00374 family)
MSSASSKRWKVIINIVTLAALVALIYFLRDQIVSTFRNLQNVNLWVLALLPLWQLINYHSYSKMYGHILDSLGTHVRYRKLLKVQLELNFVNNVFPSGGVSGISYFGLRMRDYGVGTGKATLVQILKFALVFISFQILLFAGLFMLSLSGQASNFLILITSCLATLLLAGTLLVAYVMGSQTRVNTFSVAVTRLINRIIAVFRRGKPETIRVDRVRHVFTELHENFMLVKGNLNMLKRPLFYALLANAAEIATVYTVYVAFGQWVNPGAVIIAYAIANFAGLVSVLPGGVGIYEALMTAVLAAAGIPAALSLPVTVMYRILNMAIQLPPGYYFYHKALHSRENEDERAAA